MTKFEVGEVPKTTPHLLADLVELLLPFGGYSEVSRSDVETLIVQSSSASDLLDEDRRTAGSGTSAERNEKLQTYIEDAFIQLDFRQASFGTCYPFRLENEVLAWGNELAGGRDLYMFLLICSRLRSFQRDKRQTFASLFEQLCREVMKELLPIRAAVRVFGANSDDRRNYYGTNYQEALRKLGRDLNEYVIEECIKKESTSGDGGLDIVGLLNLGDRGRGSWAMFGQCAARELEWPEKTLEAHPIHFSSFFSFAHQPANVVFIPVCYRDARGEWIKESPSSGCVLIDRLRICNLLKGKRLPDEISTIFTQGSIVIA